ncbi:hypothetical protein SRHO_G00087360 [Serrasalmus rhombeus]
MVATLINQVMPLPPDHCQHQAQERPANLNAIFHRYNLALLTANISRHGQEQREETLSWTCSNTFFKQRKKHMPMARFHQYHPLTSLFPTPGTVQNGKTSSPCSWLSPFSAPALSFTKVDLQPCCGHRRKPQVLSALTLHTGLRVCPILPASRTRKTKECSWSQGSALFMKLATAVERTDLQPKVRL